MQINSNEAIIWSQPNCIFCDKAKGLLKLKGIKYYERVLGEGTYTKEDLFNVIPTARSVPQIFIGDSYIGGYVELQKYLNDNNKTA